MNSPFENIDRRLEILEGRTERLMIQRRGLAKGLIDVAQKQQDMIDTLNERVTLLRDGIVANTAAISSLIKRL